MNVSAFVVLQLRPPVSGMLHHVGACSVPIFSIQCGGGRRLTLEDETTMLS